MSEADFTFLFSLVSALGAGVFIANALGLDLRIWGKGAATNTNTHSPLAPNRRRLRLALALAIVSFISSGIGWYHAEHPNVSDWHSSKQETIYAKSYHNETVEIDGKTFDHCHFENVKLLFHGLSPVTFNQSDFKGELYFGSDNVAIDQFMITSSALDQLKGLIRLRNWVRMDRNGNPISLQ